MNGRNWWTDPPTHFAYSDQGHLLANTTRVRFKKLYQDAVTPSYAKNGDAGLDLTAHRLVPCIVGVPYMEYGTGIAVEIPEGYVGLVFPRSSISKLEDFYLKNSVGVIDSGYRGEIMMRFCKSHEFYDAGEKIGQLIILPYPTIQLEEVEDLSDSQRGDGGYGSTGN